MLKKFYQKKDNHPIPNKILNQAIEQNFLNFAKTQDNKLQQKNILGLIITAKDYNELPESLQILKKESIFQNLEYWLKKTSKQYIEEMDFESYGIPYLLCLKNKEHIKLIKKYGIDIDNERSIYPPLLFSLIINDNVEIETIDLFLKEGKPNLDKSTANNGNILDLIGIFPNTKTNKIIEKLLQYKSMKPKFPIEFYKNIFINKGTGGLEELKNNQLDYQEELGRQEMALFFQEVIKRKENDKEIKELLLNNLSNIDFHFETRKKVAEFKPELFFIIIENKEKLNLKFEHFKDFLFFLEYSIHLDNSEKLNPDYKKNMDKSLQIIKTYIQNVEIKKNITEKPVKPKNIL